MLLDWTLSLHLLAAAQGVTYTPNEGLYLPVLREELATHWPGATHCSRFAAQIRQETCPFLRSKKCFSPTAELKTEREYGFGLGQITITDKFNNFLEAKKLDPSLKDWTWENRYTAAFQIRTLVLMDRFNHGKFTWATDPDARMAFAFAAYNGGIGGVLSDRTVCRQTSGCDPDLWFGNVANTSKKSKVSAKGYGKSFFEINREYVDHVMITYPPRYQPFFGE